MLDAECIQQGRLTSDGDMDWRPFRPVGPLAPGVIELWQIDLLAAERQEKMVALAESLLCPDECQRADSMLVPAARARFILTRALLRSVLGHHLRRPSSEIVFELNAHGKPFLPLAGDDLPTDHPPLFFNASHTPFLALIALVRGRMIGVDVEMIDPTQDHLMIARRYFSSAERLELESASLDKRPATFTRLWTRKEAVLKLYGTGWSGLQALNEAGLAHTRPIDIHQFPLPQDHRAAVAVERSIKPHI